MVSIGVGKPSYVGQAWPVGKHSAVGRCGESSGVGDCRKSRSNGGNRSNISRSSNGSRSSLHRSRSKGCWSRSRSSRRVIGGVDAWEAGDDLAAGTGEGGPGGDHGGGVGGHHRAVRVDDQPEGLHQPDQGPQGGVGRDCSGGVEELPPPRAARQPVDERPECGGGGVGEELRGGGDQALVGGREGGGGEGGEEGRRARQGGQGAGGGAGGGGGGVLEAGDDAGQVQARQGLGGGQGHPAGNQLGRTTDKTVQHSSVTQFEAMKGLPLTRNFMLQLCDALVFKPMWRPREPASIYR